MSLCKNNSNIIKTSSQRVRTQAGDRNTSTLYSIEYKFESNKNRMIADGVLENLSVLFTLLEYRLVFVRRFFK